MSASLLWAVKKVTKVYVFKKSTCEMFRIFFTCILPKTMWFMKSQKNFENMTAGFLLRSQNKSFSFSYLNFTWLYGSWHHQRILKKYPFWKHDSRFSSEVSKPTSVKWCFFRHEKIDILTKICHSFWPN